MDKYSLARMIKRSDPVEKEAYIQEKSNGKTVLDLGCIRHSAEFAEKDPKWLHSKIRSVAKKTVGIDYLPEEVEKLRKKGFDIRFGDVTKPLDIDERFDVIVAGDLIEHLSNFDGFFDNCTRLLKEEGILIITTPNPFYTDEFHYVAYKKDYIINPEHTCWIDPQALSQLAARFGYSIAEAHFLKHTWKLKGIICEKQGDEYDILNDRWKDSSKAKLIYRLAAGNLFNIIFAPFKNISSENTKLIKYSDYLAVLKKNRP